MKLMRILKKAITDTPHISIYSRHSAQKIRIIYRDIGEWDYDDAAEAEQ